MDMESDMSDGDMVMLGIFRPTIIIHPPLARPFEPKTAREGRRKFWGQKLRGEEEKGAERNESVQGQ